MASIYRPTSSVCTSCLRRLFNHQIRALSTTPRKFKHGALPTFPETPSEDLNTILSTFKSNIFLPSHLIDAQKVLIYKKKHQALLTETDEPATVKLGNEIHPLKPLDHTKDELPTKESVRKVTDLMYECGDWRPLAPFLEGMTTAGRKIKADQRERMIRRARLAQKQGIILDVLRRVEGTGMGLWDITIAREVVSAGLDIAVKDGWGETGVRSAVKYLNQVEGMLWEERHAGAGQLAEGEVHPRNRPEVLAVLVLMRSVLQFKYAGGKDEDGDVERLAGLMVKGLERTEVKFEGDWMEANDLLCAWAPVWFAAKFAKDIVGGETPLGRSLAERTDAVVRPLIEECEGFVKEYDTTKGRPRRGLMMLKDLEGASSV